MTLRNMCPSCANCSRFGIFGDLCSLFPSELSAASKLEQVCLFSVFLFGGPFRVLRAEDSRSRETQMLCSDLVSGNVDIDKKEEPVVVLPITVPSMFRSPSKFRGWQSIINFQSLVVIHKT